MKIRRHHNNQGRHRIKTGKLDKEVTCMARRLGVSDKERNISVKPLDSEQFNLPEKITYRGLNVSLLVFMNDTTREQTMSFALEKGEIILPDKYSVRVQYLSGGNPLTDPFYKGPVRLIILEGR